MKHRKNYQNLDLTGKRFGRLLVLQKYENGRSAWVCQCDCGNTVVLTASKLLDRTISCGCALKEAREKFAKNLTTHGDSYTKLYSVYRNMIDRCYSETNVNYKRYGLKGIKVCEEWRKSYLSFKEWALKNGYDEKLDRKEQSLDRIDFDGDYSPQNCRWATAKEQAENKHNTKFYYFNGEMITASRFADIYGIKDKMFVYGRLKRGRTLDDVLFEWEFQNNIPKNLIDCSTYANENNITTTTVIRKIKKGEIKAKKVGRKWYVEK